MLCLLFFLSILLTPRSTRTYTPLPYTTLFRSSFPRRRQALSPGRGRPDQAPRRRAQGRRADGERQMMSRPLLRRALLALLLAGSAAAMAEADRKSTRLNSSH